MKEQTMKIISEINTIRDIEELRELNIAVVNRMKRINTTNLNSFNVGAVVEVKLNTGYKLGTILTINRKTATVKMIDGGLYRVSGSLLRLAEKKEG